MHTIADRRAEHRRDATCTDGAITTIAKALAYFWAGAQQVPEELEGKMATNPLRSS